MDADIDWELVKRQKQELLQIANNGHPNLHGLVHLLETIQNYPTQNEKPAQPIMTSSRLTTEDLEKRFATQDARVSTPFQLEIEGEDIHWLDTATVKITMLRIYWKILHAIEIAHKELSLFELISRELSCALDGHASKMIRQHHEEPKNGRTNLTAGEHDQ